jgi:hypothetical protein
MKTLFIKTSIALIITFFTWYLLIAFRDYLIIAGLSFLISISLTIMLFKKNKIIQKLTLLCNPFILLSLFSFLGGTFSVVSGHPKLVFVCYHVDALPFSLRDRQIKSRVSLDPELGILDYINSVPNNIAVRFLMSCTDKVDNKFVLVYTDELPNKLHM